MYILCFAEICLLTNAKRVASVRAETYVNVYSLCVNHFNIVLERYPVMRRTMESVAAERLTKIGKNPSLVSSRADLEEDQKLVNEIVMESTPVVTSASEDEDKDSDDSSESSKSSKRKRKFKFDFTGRLHRITEERKSKSKESLRDIDIRNGKVGRMKKAPSGPNLFGLRVPHFPDRRRSGSVGADLDRMQTSCAEDSRRDSDPEELKQDAHRRSSFLGSKLFKPLEPKHQKTKKSRDKRKSNDDSPQSESKSVMQFLQIPDPKETKEHKQKTKEETAVHRRSMGDGEESTDKLSKAPPCSMQPKESTISEKPATRPTDLPTSISTTETDKKKHVIVTKAKEGEPKSESSQL